MTVTLTINSGSLVAGDFSSAPWGSIQILTLGASGSPTTINRTAPWNIVIAASNDGSNSSLAYFQLSSAFQTGDVVELTNSNEVWITGTVLLSTGGPQYFGNSGFGATDTHQKGGPFTIRKLSSVEWVLVP